ncbi:MAG: energy-coupling factor transporter ATPase [Oscillospiraceae bacterium]|nr:energy-coupling factor transporter ATPase [Oscillospiraceae bacterium]
MLKLENVTYTYQPNGPFEKTAVRDVNLQVELGEFVGIIGHTGSGKSTLIQMLNALIKPTSGKVFVDNVATTEKGANLRDIRFKVGLVMQYPEYQLFEETIYKDIAFGPKNMGLGESEIDRRVRASAQLVGIGEELLEKSPFEISGGQKRRVAIAGVLAMEPKVLILDEPTAGLDPIGREEILCKIRDMHRETGIAVILISHSMEDVARYANRIIVMNKGQIAADDTPDAIFAQVEMLESIGLSVPQITKIAEGLNRRGFALPSGIHDLQTGKFEILKAIEGVKPC